MVRANILTLTLRLWLAYYLANLRSSSPLGNPFLPTPNNQQRNPLPNLVDMIRRACSSRPILTHWNNAPARDIHGTLLSLSSTLQRMAFWLPWLLSSPIHQGIYPLSPQVATYVLSLFEGPCFWVYSLPRYSFQQGILCLNGVRVGYIDPFLNWARISTASVALTLLLRLEKCRDYPVSLWGVKDGCLLTSSRFTFFSCSILTFSQREFVCHNSWK